MGKIKKMILDGANAYGVECEHIILNNNVSLNMNEVMIRKYTSLSDYYCDETLYWNSFKSGIKVHGAETYNWIQEYIGNSECYALVPQEAAVIGFKSGYDLIKAYYEYGAAYDLYVSDRKFSYLFCFCCDEEMLFAYGDAESWLCEKAKENMFPFFFVE